jgi:diguanylate cyclase (GGDEF)-like protein
MHKLLRRQLRKLLPNAEQQKHLHDFLNAVSQAYEQADAERNLLERSLDLTSKELSARNRELNQKLQQLERLHQDLESSLATLQATFDSTGEAIFALDSRSFQVVCNRLGKEVLRIEASGNRFSLKFCLRQFKQRMKNPRQLAKLIQQEEIYEKRDLFQTIEFVDDTIYEVYSSPKILNDELIGRVWCFRDVTDYKRSQAIIKHQAFHDALTDLPNRLLLNDRLEHAIAIAKRDNSKVAILFIDLDHFKKVNDSAGHQVGDQVLIRVSESIKRCLREQDTLARIGGDEFVVLVESVPTTAAITNLGMRIINVVKEPISCSGAEYFIGCSIGISVYPRDGTSVQELMRKADMSMYHAKRSGRENLQYFNESLERFAIHQLSLESKLRAAIKKQELSMYYQPKIDLQSGECVSAEALLRWLPDGKSVSPAEFIPVAEQSGLIREITDWVFTDVCRQISEWKKFESNLPRIAINLSSISFNDQEFLALVDRVLDDYDIEGKNVEFEITETVLLKGTNDVNDFVERLKQKGITLAIDDFGTGYSSLSYLHKLSIDALKIDKSFIIDLLKNEQNKTITLTILSLAKHLGLQVVAEGVETQDVCQWLKDNGCDYAQGFLFSRPIPADLFFQKYIVGQDREAKSLTR